MSLLLKAAITVVSLLAFCLSVNRASAQVFNPETFTLTNGMQVVVIPNHRVPVLTHMVWYRVGSADEMPGKTGLAHMVEHMMFKGTKAVPAGQFSQIVARNGGRENAFTTADYTGFYQNVAADKLETVMRLESDRMANLKLADQDFQPERQVVLEERRMRVDNDPDASLHEQMEAALHLNGGYHHPVIGWKSDIEGFQLDDVVAFYRRWYAPNNAILVVAGDITAKQLKPLAQKYYGAIPARPLPERVRPGEPEPIAGKTVRMIHPNVQQPSWSRDYLAPSYQRGATGHAYALQVLREILGGGATGRLYKTLVVERKIAADVGAGYDPTAIGASSFSLGVTPREGETAEAAGEAVAGLIDDIVKTGVSADEVARAKTRLRANVAYARDSVAGSAQVLGRALASGQSVEDIESWPARIDAVTADGVNAAARAVFGAKGSVTGLLLPQEDGAGAAAGPQPARTPGQGREIR